MNKSASVFLAGVTTGLLAACILGALLLRPKTSGGPDTGARGIVLKLAHGLDEAHPVHQAMTLMKQRLEEQNERLKRLSELTRVPVAEYIRQGIDLILAQHRQLINPDRQLDFEHLLMTRKP